MSRPTIAFSGIMSLSSQRGIYVSDGTYLGTHLVDVASAYTGSGGLAPVFWWGSVQRDLLFEGYDSSGNTGLWATDGTAAGTVELIGGWPGGTQITSSARLGSTRSVISAEDASGNRNLWITDGTVAGTAEITPAGVGGVLSPVDLVSFCGQVAFSGTVASAGSGLWVTDGTLGGTHELTVAKAWAAGTPLYPEGLAANHITAFGSRFLFAGRDSEGAEALFCSDGTSAGTIELSVYGVGPYSPGPMIALGGLVLLNGTWSGSSNLWVTDGTVAGTKELSLPGKALNPRNFDVLGTKVLFWDSIDGVWVTDGTVAGTIELISNLGLNKAGAIGPFVNIGNKAVFAAYDRTAGKNAIWVTDGTVAGTSELVVTGGYNNQIAPKHGWFTAAGSLAYFSATDENGKDGLWVTDGTSAGTYEVAATWDNIHQLLPSTIVAFPWLAITAHDFSGTGTSSVLLRNAAGVTYLWSMHGATVAAATTTSVQVGTNWQIRGIGDFDGDGRADLLWSYANTGNAADPLNGVSYVSFQDGAAATGGGVVQQLSTAWAIAGVGDFDADGRTDVLYRNASTGATYLDLMNGAAIDWSTSGFTSAQVTDPNWTVAAVADFDGNGTSDVLWRYFNAANAADPLNGTLYEWAMDGKTVTSAGLLGQQASGNWKVVGTGDFDGSGTADILFRYENTANASDPLNGITYVDFMIGTTVTGGAPTQWQVDDGWTVASIGDYDGDGRSDILWQQTSTGNTFVWLMNGAGVSAGMATSSQAGTGWTVQNGTLIG